MYTIYNGDNLDRASQLTKLVVEDRTHLNLWVGTAVNPADQNPGFPADFSIKGNVVEALVKLLNQWGKEVMLTYIDKSH